MKPKQSPHTALRRVHRLVNLFWQFARGGSWGWLCVSGSHPPLLSAWNATSISVISLIIWSWNDALPTKCCFGPISKEFKSINTSNVIDNKIHSSGKYDTMFSFVNWLRRKQYNIIFVIPFPNISYTIWFRKLTSMETKKIIVKSLRS